MALLHTHTLLTRTTVHHCDQFRSHTLRLLAAQYVAVKAQVDKETLVSYQQTFQLVAELTAKFEATRLEASIPGSTPQAGLVLFGKDEVQEAAQVEKVNSTKS